MVDDFATLSMRVREEGVTQGERSLRRLQQTGARTERSMGRVTRASAGMGRGLSRTSSEIQGLNRMARRLLVTFGGLATARAALRRLGDIAELGDLADQLGTTTEELTRLQYAADQTGSSGKALASGLDRMNQLIGQSLERGSGRAADAMEALGLSIDSVAQMNPADQFDAIADAVSNIESPTQRAYVAQQLFGRSNVELVNTLTRGSQEIRRYKGEADRLGATMGRDQVNAANEARLAINRVQSSMGAAADTAIAELAPQITGLADKLNDFIGEAADSGQLEDFFHNVADAAETLLDNLKEIAQYGAALKGATTGARAGSAVGTVFGPLGTAIGGGIGAIGGGAAGYFGSGYAMDSLAGSRGDSDDRTMARRLIDAEGGTIAAPGGEQEAVTVTASPDAANGGGKESGGRNQLRNTRNQRDAANEAEKAAKRLQRQYESNISTLEKEIALSDEDGHAAKMRYELAHGELSALNESQKQHLQQLAEEADRIEEQTELARDAGAAWARAAQEKQQNTRRVTEELQTQEESERAAMERRRRMIEDSALSEERQNGLKQRNWDKYIESIESGTGHASQMAREAANQIENSMGSTLEQMLSGHFDNIGEMWAKTIQQMIAHAAAAKLTEALFGEDFGRSGSGGSSDIGGLIGKGISAAASAFSGGPSGAESQSLSDAGIGAADMLGFASGGYTGDGARDEVAGVVHGREYVMNADATQRFGPMLDSMNKGQMPRLQAPQAGGGGSFAPSININYHESGSKDPDERQRDMQNMTQNMKEQLRQLWKQWNQEDLAHGGPVSRGYKAQFGLNNNNRVA